MRSPLACGLLLDSKSDIFPEISDRRDAPFFLHAAARRNCVFSLMELLKELMKLGDPRNGMLYRLHSLMVWGMLRGLMAHRRVKRFCGAQVLQ
jgi:hypothetical protein